MTRAILQHPIDPHYFQVHICNSSACSNLLVIPQARPLAPLPSFMDMGRAAESLGWLVPTSPAEIGQGNWGPHASAVMWRNQGVERSRRDRAGA